MENKQEMSKPVKYDSIYNIVLDKLKENKISKSELSKRTGIPYRTICYILSKKKRFYRTTIDNVCAILKVFGLSNTIIN